MANIDKIFDKKNYTYIIAEVAQAHDGSLGMAHAFIDAVADAGADAIKFQAHYAEEESSNEDLFRVKFSYEDQTRFDYWKRMEFSKEQWKGLYEHCQQRNIDFLCSPFSKKSIDILNDIGIKAWKVSSGEVFNNELLEQLLETKKPLIISTGMSTWQDIDEQITQIRKANVPFVILQCTTSYPSLPSKIGINILPEIKERYQCRYGLSDHSATIFPALAAATLKASIVETHVTFNMKMFGPDVPASITIDQLEELVKGIRFINEMNDNPLDKTEIESSILQNKELFTRSIFICNDLQCGDTISEKDIKLLKPGIGLNEKFKKDILGKRVNQAVKKGTMLSWEMIQK